LVKAYFSKFTKYKNLKFITEDFISGTFGSLRVMKSQRSKNIFISNCDIIVNCDYSKLLKYHLIKNNDLTIVTVNKNLQVPYGVCEINKNNELLDFKEKPKIKTFINAGLYIIKNSIIKDFFYKKKMKKYDTNELIKDLISQKKKIGVFNINQNEWIDIGQMKEYKKNIGKLNV
jgi:NDP-sugar pyrophosphorylase family protein